MAILNLYLKELLLNNVNMSNSLRIQTEGVLLCKSKELTPSNRHKLLMMVRVKAQQNVI